MFKYLSRKSNHRALRIKKLQYINDLCAEMNKNLLEKLFGGTSI